MVLNENELRQHLVAAVDHVSAPRFTMDGLISRIRRRRAKIFGLALGSLLAVVAIAAAVPIALSGPSTPPKAFAPGLAFDLSFKVAVNGQTQMLPKNGAPPSFTVTAGKHLRIHIGVIVPAHIKVTTLWIGVSRGEFSSPGRSGQQPQGMRPVLVHIHKPLTPGLHTFMLTWTMPAQLTRSTPLWLAAAWATKQQDARVGQPIAEFVTRR